MVTILNKSLLRLQVDLGPLDVFGLPSLTVTNQTQMVRRLMLEETPRGLEVWAYCGPANVGVDSIARYRIVLEQVPVVLRSYILYQPELYTLSLQNRLKWAD